VDSKGNELVNTLASKYTEALKSVDDEIDAEKERNQGLIAKAVNAVKGVIDTILKLKDLLLGVLARAASAVMAIISDPIGFLGHLVDAVGAGLHNFIANIGGHLKKGLIGWLMGNLANAGVQLPDKFDLRGILGMIASLLGLTWAAIRGRIVSRGVPDQAMTAVEETVPVAQKIQKEGIGGVWEEIKEKIGDLKENLFGKISEYLIPTVLVAGITWIISLLNPASAFIKACKMIIDIVTFIIDRGAQILAFVNSVLDAIIAIAGGGAGGVPALIEDALAKSIPVLIGALAAILGVSGIADKIKEFIQSLSRPVMKAVDWVVDKIVGVGKKIWAKMRGFGGRIKDKLKDRFGRKEGTGKNAGQPGAGAAGPEHAEPAPRPVVTVPFSMAGEGHTLTMKPAGDSVDVTMASVELPLTKKFSTAHTQITYFRHYIETITDPVVRARYQAEIEPQLAAFDAPSVAAFKVIYDDTFPKGEAPKPLGKDTERVVANKVRPLVARAETMLAQIKAWGDSTGVKDLSAAEFDRSMTTKGKKAWEESYLAVKAQITTVLAGFTYRGRPLEYRGSAREGWRGVSKGKTRFDARDFDLDLYVVHPERFDDIRRTAPQAVQGDKIFAGGRTSDLLDLQTRVRAALREAFPDVDRVGRSDIVLRREAK
jgi:hypothetical protein